MGTDDESATISDDDLSEDDTKEDDSNIAEEQRQRQIKCQRAKDDLASMTCAAQKSILHWHTVPYADPLLKFHTPVPKKAKAKPTVSEIFSYLSRCSGSQRPVSTIIADIGTFKQMVRAELDLSSSSSQLSPDTIANIKDLGPLVKIQEEVRFAGRTYQIDKTVHRDSAEYQRHLKARNNNLGGGLQCLDEAVQQLKGFHGVTSVEKSRSDWASFKRARNFTDELESRKRDGYLSTQAFLASVSHAQYNQSLEARRQKRIFEDQKKIN